MISSIPLITQPSDWRDLQKKVAKILTGCGFETAVEKRIDTVRGSVVIDVHAEKSGSNQGKVLCECKHWNRRVTKIMVHAFRTVLGDSGSSQGIIISKNGFQKGAYEAARYANLSLYSWVEFVAAFTPAYFQYTIDRNYRKGHELRMVEHDVLERCHQGPSLLSVDEFNDFQLKREVNSDFILFSFRDGYQNMDTLALTPDDVECGVHMGIKNFGITPGSLEEYFDYIYENCCRKIQEVNFVLTLIGERATKKVG